MEVIRINESKLKIMLTAEETRRYDLCGEENGGADEAADGKETGTGRKLRPVLERARRSCGFDTSPGRVMVRLFPSREGGCELFVTRLSEEDAPGLSALSARPAEGSRSAPEVGEYFGFPALGELLAACRVLAARGLGAGSRVWRSPAGYFLALTAEDADRAGIAEFGTPEPAAWMRVYIPEHAAPLLPPGGSSGNDGSAGNDAAFLGRF